MKLDKTQLIGYILLGLLLVAFFYYNSKGQQAYQLEQQKKADSIARIQKSIHPESEKTVAKSVPAPAKNTTLNLPQKEYLDTLETDLFTVILSNKGGTIKKLTLKKYNNTFENHKVTLLNSNTWEFNYPIRISETQILPVKDLVFQKSAITKTEDNITLTYTFQDGQERTLQHIYTFRKNDYKIDFKLAFPEKSNTLLDQNALNATWTTSPQQQEKNISYERGKAEISILDKTDDFEAFTVGSGVEETFKKSLKWLSVRQQFFNMTLISTEGNLENVKTVATTPQDTSQAIVKNQSFFLARLNAQNEIPLHWYIGPNDYDILSSYNLELERLVDIGQGAMSFLKYINKALVMPLFNFLKNHIANYGIVILLLTIFIRLITTPLLYSSYKSAAKMKLLNPEIEELKKKYGGDEQTLALKRMELYRDAGANPLQGCIPMLLQIPIFFALYYFFNSNIDLREQSFLWAEDLSSYDSIADLSFNIPFYGNHVSLFTLLNVVTSFATAFLNRSTAVDQSNAMMKYFPYIMPLFFLGLFNSLPSGLTWYYTISNVITIILQIIIQKFIINHDKLLAQIEIKRKQPKKKSVWLAKAEEMQKAKQKLQEKNATRK